MTSPVTSWRDEAACTETPPEWFYGRPDASASPHWPQAITTCAHCPVTAECLRLGLSLGAGGVWGGRVLRQDIEVMMGRKKATFG